MGREVSEILIFQFIYLRKKLSIKGPEWCYVNDWFEGGVFSAKLKLSDISLVFKNYIFDRRNYTLGIILSLIPKFFERKIYK